MAPPKSSGYDSVLVIVDRFSKMAHFVPCNKNNNSRRLAILFCHNVFCLHGIPSDIVSDWGTTFASALWIEFCSLLGPKVCLSTSFQPQTDGQTERTHQGLAAYLRAFTNYQQDDWSSLLDTAKFAYNNANRSATGQSPFFTVYGYNSSSVLDQPAATLLLSPRFTRRSPMPHAHNAATALVRAHNNASNALAAARERMATATNRLRATPPPFAVGQKFLLRSEHLFVDRPSQKLSDKYVGPFTIVNKREHADTLSYKSNPLVFRLDIAALTASRSGKTVHDHFHVDQLVLYQEPDSVPGRPCLVRPPPTVLNDNLYVVSSIKASRLYRRKMQYFVLWERYGDEDAQWVPATNFHFDNQLVVDFATLDPNVHAPSSTRRLIAQKHRPRCKAGEELSRIVKPLNYTDLNAKGYINPPGRAGQSVVIYRDGTRIMTDDPSLAVRVPAHLITKAVPGPMKVSRVQSPFQRSAPLPHQRRQSGQTELGEGYACPDRNSVGNPQLPVMRKSPITARAGLKPTTVWYQL